MGGLKEEELELPKFQKLLLTADELFVKETLDPRIESVMPILKRLSKNIGEMKEVSELAEWANNVTEEESLKSNNPIGIPEGESKERPYICVHTKKGKCEVKANSSYEAAKKAAQHWKLKSTAGIDAHLADVTHDPASLNEVTRLSSAQDTGNVFELYKEYLDSFDFEEDNIDKSNSNWEDYFISGALNFLHKKGIPVRFRKTIVKDMLNMFDPNATKELPFSEATDLKTIPESEMSDDNSRGKGKKLAWQEVVNALSAAYPDLSPTDSLQPIMTKYGLSFDDLDNLAKKHDYRGIYDFLDKFSHQYERDTEIEENFINMAPQAVAEGLADSKWHGSNADMEWYDAYKDQPIRVKVKNHSGIGDGISGTFPVIKFEKIDATKATLTIKSRDGEMTATVNLDKPETVLTKQYDRVPAMNFYIGSMPATARQAFNLFQHKSDKQDVAESKADDVTKLFTNAYDPAYANLQRVALLAMQGRQSEAAGLLQRVIKDADPAVQKKITDAVNNIKPVTINGRVADSSTLDKSKQHQDWILNTFIPWVQSLLGQQGVAEAAPKLLKKEMPLHRHAEKLLAQNGVSKDDSDYHHHLNNTIKHLRQFGNIDLINKSDEQGVAEGSGGNWYIRVNGKILNDTKYKPEIFSSEDEARSHAMKLADKKRIPLSQIKLTKSWMDAPEQGVAEAAKWRSHPDAYDVDDEGNKTPRNPNSPKFGYDPLQRRADTANDAKTPKGKTAALKTSLKIAKGNKGVAEALDPDTQRLEQEVRDALANGDDYTAKSLVKMAQTPADRNYLRKIIRQEMYGTGPGQGGVAEGSAGPTSKEIGRAHV